MTDLWKVFEACQSIPWYPATHWFDWENYRPQEARIFCCWNSVYGVGTMKGSELYRWLEIHMQLCVLIADILNRF